VNGTRTVTNYLTDLNNPSGYSQVLEEHTNGSSAPSMSYVIGLTVLGQTPASAGTSFFMPDGQGSTRQLTDPTGTVTARFAFDAYGNLLYVAVGVLNSPATKILYTGQLFDVVLLQYNLRARFYNPSNGRFSQADTYSGDTFVPLTLHKFIYTDADPINKSDPLGLSGDFTLIQLAVVISIVVVLGVIAWGIWSATHRPTTRNAKITIVFYFETTQLNGQMINELKRIYEDCRARKAAPGTTLKIDWQDAKTQGGYDAEKSSFGHVKLGEMEVGLKDDLRGPTGHTEGYESQINPDSIRKYWDIEGFNLDKAYAAVIAHELWHAVTGRTNFAHASPGSIDSFPATVGSTFTDSACDDIIKALQLEKK
jgi:RHS repeat-associated protein